MMFKKVKFIVVCAIVALGLASCSSDDGNPVLKLEQKKYNVLIEITEDVEMSSIVAFYYDGVHIKEEVIYTPPPVVDEDAEGEQNEPKTTQWNKAYVLTVAEHVSIEAKGKGSDVSSKLKITVTDKDEFVLQDKKVEGKDLFLEVKL